MVSYDLLCAGITSSPWIFISVASLTLYGSFGPLVLSGSLVLGIYCGRPCCCLIFFTKVNVAGYWGVVSSWHVGVPLHMSTPPICWWFIERHMLQVSGSLLPTVPCVLSHCSGCSPCLLHSHHRPPSVVWAHLDRGQSYLVLSMSKTGSQLPDNLQD